MLVADGIQLSYAKSCEMSEPLLKTLRVGISLCRNVRHSPDTRIRIKEVIPDAPHPQPRFAPVIHAEASQAISRNAPLRSSGLPRRRMGILSIIRRPASVPKNSEFMSVPI